MARYVDVIFDVVPIQIELQTKQTSIYRPEAWLSSPQWWAKGVRGPPAATVAAFPASRAMVPTRRRRVSRSSSSTPMVRALCTSGSPAAWVAASSTARALAALPRTGQWRPIDKPIPHTWFGLMFKAGGGLGPGAEGQAAVLISAMNRPARLHDRRTGADGLPHRRRRGRPGGRVATGFTKADDFQQLHTADGLDWALSFGGKFGDYVKSAGKLGPLLRGANGMLEALDGAARLKALKDVALKPGVETEIYGVAKSLISSSLIDTDLQSITAVDIPLAGVGAEIGIYYAKTGYKCLSEW